jgi:nitrite reductase/ring-hydroxylating ferredoxin subunit
MCEKEDDGYVPVFEDKDLKEGEITSIQEQHPELPILLAKVDGEVFAIGDQCPHWGVSLHGAWLHRFEDAYEYGWTIVCPQHGLHFSLRTGENVEILIAGGESTECKLRKFDCKVKDGKIWLRV